MQILRHADFAVTREIYRKGLAGAGVRHGCYEPLDSGVPTHWQRRRANTARRSQLPAPDHTAALVPLRGAHFAGTPYGEHFTSTALECGFR
jgi:hypothetical protein